jgi:ClpP class serine protease
LSRVGVGLDVVTAGAFKSAMEPLTRTAPTPENREALEALVGDLAERVVADIAAGCALELDAVRAALDASPLVPEDALARGLVSALIAEDDLRDTLDMGPKGKARRVRAEHYRGRPAPCPACCPGAPRWPSSRSTARSATADSTKTHRRATWVPRLRLCAKRSSEPRRPNACAACCSTSTALAAARPRASACGALCAQSQRRSR